MVLAQIYILQLYKGPKFTGTVKNIGWKILDAALWLSRLDWIYLVWCGV